MKSRFQFSLLAISLLALPISACQAFKAADEAQAIPFTLFKTGIVIDMSLNGGPPLPFVFDTGLSVHNLLSREVSETLDVAIKGSAGFTDSSGGRGSTPVGEIPDVRVGPAELGTQIFAIVPIPDSLKIRDGKAPIAGYTGPPLTEDAVLCVDYGAQQIQRFQPGHFDSTPYERVAMPLNHKLLTVDVVVDGEKATLAIDTGADSGVHLFAEFVRKHSLIERYPDLERGDAQSGSGRSMRILTGTANTVLLGEHAFDNVPMLFMPQAFDPAWGIDGLLGYAFLSRINPCLDRDGETLFWLTRGAGELQ